MIAVPLSPRPSRIGRLHVERRLGAGGFATVWLAHDPDLDDAVAVKVLAENWAGQAEIRRRFVDEARLLRRVDSDHLVRVYDIGELPDGRPYFVMTHADLGNLSERVEQLPPPWSPDAVLEVVDAIAAGLTVLHRSGVIHRDVKPSNVLLRGESGGGERVLLGDLGIAKDLRWASDITMPAGSSWYMAPEQRGLSDRIGPASDVHALAVTAGQLFGLATPWDDSSLGQVLRRGAWPEPERRTQTPAAFAEQLRDVLGSVRPGAGGRAVAVSPQAPITHVPPPPPPGFVEAGYVAPGYVAPAPVAPGYVEAGYVGFDYPQVVAQPGGTSWTSPPPSGSGVPVGSPAVGRDASPASTGRTGTVARRRSGCAPVAGALAVAVLLGAAGWWGYDRGRRIGPPSGVASVRVSWTWTLSPGPAYPGGSRTGEGIRAVSGARATAVAYRGTF
jgi:serine/threonine protein kinase